MTQKKREELANWRELFRFVMVALLGVISWSFVDLRRSGFTFWNFLGWITVLVLVSVAVMIWFKMQNLLGDKE